MSRYISPVITTTDLNGAPMVGAKLVFYESGTSTLKTIYSDEALTVPLTNPVTSVSSGAGAIYPRIFIDGVYKVVQQDDTGTPGIADGAVLWTRDPVNSAFSAKDITVTPSGNITSTTQQDVNNELDSEKLQRTASISTLRTLTPLSPDIKTSIQVLGYYTPGDGGGGPLRVVKTAPVGGLVDNGGSILSYNGAVDTAIAEGELYWGWEWSGAYNLSWFGLKGLSGLADNAVFEAARDALASDGAIINPKGSLVDFANVTLPADMMIIDEEKKRIIASEVAFGKSYSAGGTHMLIRDIRENEGTRVHQEPNGYPVGLASKYDWMFDPYEDDTANYRIINVYTRTYNPADVATQQGDNGVATLNVKGTGNHWGVWPSYHFGFSDDGGPKTTPMKMYYFDTSDTAWRTPMIGAWRTGKDVTTGDYITASNSIYQAASTGLMGSTVPSHASGTVSDGSVDFTFVRDISANAASVAASVVFGDRDDMPKFGFVDSRVQFAKPTVTWNGVDHQYLDSTGSVAWNIRSQLNQDDLYIESGDGLKKIRLDPGGEFMQVIGLATLQLGATAPDGDTTPSVKGAPAIVFGNTAATSVTQFDDALGYQVLYVQSGNSNTTLIHGTNLKLAGGVDRLLTVDDCLIFQMSSNGSVAKQVVS